MGAMLLTACGDDDPIDPVPVRVTYNRTVLMYMSAENDLSGDAEANINDMLTGSVSIGANDALIVYVDKSDKNNKPYMMRIKNGKKTDKVTLKSDDCSADPRVMAKILSYTSSTYPAKEYGIVLWGHASGWVIEDSLTITAAKAPKKKAYGYDSGTDSQTGAFWMNMYTLAKTLNSWGKPLKFIMADCCQFQCIESAYELRKSADYIIGSPAEIPGKGAPYDKMVPCLFDKSELFYEKIVDAYYAQSISNIHLPLSVIRTSKLEPFAEATHTALQTFALPAGEGPDLRSQRIIYYKGNYFNSMANTMYDMYHYMLKNASETVFNTWKTSFDEVVVYKKFAPVWITFSQINFSSADMEEENYGGLSMYVPQVRGDYYTKYSSAISQTQWYWAAGFNELGW